MEGSIGIKVVKTGKNQDLNKKIEKHMMLKTHQHVGGVIYEEMYEQKCQISKKNHPKRPKKGN